MFDRAVAQAQHLVEPAEQQSSTPQLVVGCEDDSPRNLRLEELLALSELGLRLAHLADLREDPRGGGDHGGKDDGDVPRPEGRDAVLEQ
jgi:hypothetical protein